GLSYEEAEARKLRHSEGLLSSDQHRQVSELLGADAEVLLQGLALSIKELSRGERLPSSIYLCGGGSLLPELTVEMVKNNWSAGTRCSSCPCDRASGRADSTSSCCATTPPGWASA